MNGVPISRYDVEKIVFTYFKEQLHLKGVHWHHHRLELSTSTNARIKEFVNVLNELSSDLRTANVGYNEIRGKTASVIEVLNRQDQSDLSESGYLIYSCIAEGLFSQGIKWNHILTLFVFTLELAYDYSQSCQNLNRITTVFEWLVNYIYERLLSWINNHKGWDGLIDYYNQSKTSSNPIQSYWRHAAVIAGTILAFSVYQLAYRH